MVDRPRAVPARSTAWARDVPPPWIALAADRVVRASARPARGAVAAEGTFNAEVVEAVEEAVGAPAAVAEEAEAVAVADVAGDEHGQDGGTHATSRW